MGGLAGTGARWRGRVAAALLALAGASLAASFAACSSSRGPEATPLSEVGKGFWHTLERGETLWELSRRFGVPVAALVRANRIEDPRRLAVGQRIFVPGVEAPPPAPVVAEREPTVRGCRVEDRVRQERQAAARRKGDVAFAWPVRGRITTCFRPLNGRPHDGIDIAVPSRTPVRAAERGRVVYSASLGAYGNLVVLRHGGEFTTLYAHNRRNLAAHGDVVEKGQVIAEAGDTGNATGPHLHFEIRRERRPDNPILYLP